MYKVYNGKNWIDFDSYDELLNWLSQFNEGKEGAKARTNTFLSKVGNNTNDTYRSVVRVKTGEFITVGNRVYDITVSVVSYEQRDYRVCTIDGIGIYDYNLINDVLSYNHNHDRMRKSLLKKNKEKNKNKLKKYIYHRYLYIPESAYPEFRRGPWPFISNHHSGYGFRKIRTTNERRLTCNKESIPFNRKGRAFNLPSSWDDIMRDWRDTGWKSQGKGRHQWENKVKQKTKHTFGKSTYVCKKVDKRNYYIDDDYLSEIDDTFTDECV